MLSLLLCAIFLLASSVSALAYPKRWRRDVDWSPQKSRFLESPIPPYDGGEEDEEEEEEGEAMDRMEASEKMYGNYTSIPGFQENYAVQAEIHTNAAAVGGSWASFGPGYATGDESGRIRTIAQDPINMDTVYVLNAGGGLWKTTNFFSTQPTWAVLTDNLASTSGGSFALGTTANTIYLGLGDPFLSAAGGGYMYKSTDGGASWSSPIVLGNSVSQINQLVVDKSQSVDIVIVLTDRGIFRSTNAGASYSRVYYSGWTYMEMYIALTTVGWIGFDYVPSTKTFLSSVNNGATWNVLSSDWNTVTGGNARRTTFAVAEDGEATVYAQSAKSDGSQLDIFKSTNGGLNWVALGCNANGTPTNPKTGLQTDLNILGNQGWYNQMILVDSADSSRNTVYIGGQLTSAKTTNGGSSWTLISTWTNPSYYGLPYVHADFHYGVFLTSTSNARWLVVGTDGGLATSSNGGSTFSNDLNKGIISHLVQYIEGSEHTPNAFITGLQDQGSKYTELDPDYIYYTVLGGDGEGCGFSQAVEKLMIVSYYYQNFFCYFYSTETWYSCSTGITGNKDLFYSNLEIPSATSDPSGNIYFTRTSSTVFKSSVSGQSLTWTAIGTNGANGLSSSTFTENFHGIGVGTLSQIATCKSFEVGITLDGGASWVTRDLRSMSPYSNWKGCTSPLWVSNTMYLASNDATPGATRILKSTNNGASWIGAANGLVDVPVVRIVAEPYGSKIFAGTWLGVYVTSDGGSNWYKLGSDLPNVIANDLYVSSDSTLQVATNGRGNWKLEIGSSPTASPTVVGATNFPTALPTVSQGSSSKNGDSENWYDVFTDNLYLTGIVGLAIVILLICSCFVRKCCCRKSPESNPLVGNNDEVSDVAIALEMT